MKTWLMIFVLAIGMAAGARTLDGVDFPEQITIGTQSLVLNGVGLRYKAILWHHFHVYVAGLYLLQKTSDAEAILKSTDTRYLRMIFVRDVGAGTLRGAWREAFAKSCTDCANEKPLLKKFNDAMVEVDKKSEIAITFAKGSVNVEVHGAKKNRDAKIDSATFAHDLLAVFIGAHPPGQKFKNGLLGK